MQRDADAALAPGGLHDDACAYALLVPPEKAETAVILVPLTAERSAASWLSRLLSLSLSPSRLGSECGS